METKKCSKCKEHKGIDNFHKRNKTVDGLCDICKSCKKETSLKNKVILTEPKKCVACFIEKSLTEFNRDKYVVGGYKHKCKVCTNDKVNAYCAKEDFKICRNCLEEKPINEFTKDCSGLLGCTSRCKRCSNTEESREYKNNYYLNNKEKLNEIGKKYYVLNKEEYLKRAKKYYFENIELIKDYKKDWRKNNKDKTRNRRKSRILNDVIFKMRLSVYANVLSYFKRHLLGKKSRKTMDILGCSMEFFKEHIESQFLNWMTWENYGNCEINEYNCSWHLDHIIPISQAKTEEEIYLLNHWSNFQPLCSKINRDIKRAVLYPLTNLELNITIE